MDDLILRPDVRRVQSTIVEVLLLLLVSVIVLCRNIW